ncbi:MAG: hypothetical protein RMI49_02170 [Candidatus Caldarchaeum sp.]|nr:hypothetical protein [Candidatus Caldarchaeum sp.]
MLEVWLNAGEAMEAGAMTYMTLNIAVTTKVRESNFISALGPEILWGQFFFYNGYTSAGGR